MRLDESQRLFLKALCKQSLYHLCIICGGHVHQGGDISPITHRQLCEFAQDPAIKRKGIAMGRILRKTTVFHRWKAIWLWLNNPEVRILLGSQTITLESKSLIWIKQQLAQNMMLRFLFREELAPLDKSWIDKHRYSNTEVELPRSGFWAESTFTAIGVGGASQGNHYTHILLTDIIGQAQMESQIEMESSMLWVDNLPELLVDGKEGEIQFDFTHWKVGDAYMYLQDTRPEYQWRVVPALKCADELISRAQRGHKNIVFIQHPEQLNGETNYPDIVDEKGQQLFPTKYYTDMMGNPESERLAWTQHMNMPHMATAGANSFKFEWIKYFRNETAIIGTKQRKFICKDDREEFDPDQISWIGCIDPGGFAETKLKKSSRCAALIAGQPGNSVKKFVPWTWSGRIESPSKLLDIIFAANKEWRPKIWYCERIAAQDYILKDIKEEADRRHERLIIVGTPKDASFMAENAKDVRITGLIQPLYLGQYYLLDTSRELIGEITSFPGVTKDLVDCLAILHKLRFSGKIQAPIANSNEKRYNETLAHINRTTGY